MRFHKSVVISFENLISSNDDNKGKIIMKNKNLDKRQTEQNQNITKLYATSFAMLVYNQLHPDEDASEFGLKMIEIMRTLKPRQAVKEADILLQKEFKKSIKSKQKGHNCI